MTSRLGFSLAYHLNITKSSRIVPGLLIPIAENVRELHQLGSDLHPLGIVEHTDARIQRGTAERFAGGALEMPGSCVTGYRFLVGQVH